MGALHSKFYWRGFKSAGGQHSARMHSDPGDGRLANPSNNVYERTYGDTRKRLGNYAQAVSYGTRGKEIVWGTKCCRLLKRVAR